MGPITTTMIIRYENNDTHMCICIRKSRLTLQQQALLAPIILAMANLIHHVILCERGYKEEHVNRIVHQYKIHNKYSPDPHTQVFGHASGIFNPGTSNRCNMICSLKSVRDTFLARNQHTDTYR